MVRQFIAKLEQLSERQPLVFNYVQDGIRREGFVLKFDGQIACYENMCRHLPVKLDSGNGIFLSRSGHRIICQSHGALYEPISGMCERGPCAGASLTRLSFIITGTDLYLELPELTD